MKEEAGAGWGLIQGKRVASEPLENRRQNRWKTAGGHWQNRWKTAGKPLEKPLEKNRWQNCRKTRKTAGNRWKTGKPASNRWKNRWKTVGKPLAGGPLAKTVGKPPKTAGESPVFGSLLPVSIRDRNGLERVSPASFFGPWGGLP